ncbi:hypothetical protein Nmel_016441, partial [Mimus melanotis]
GLPAGLRALGTGPARRSEALAGAPLDTAAKEYSPKVRQLVRDIAGLTLLEVADLNALLKETLKIPDVAVMPAAAAASHLPAQAAPQVPGAPGGAGAGPRERGRAGPGGEAAGLHRAPAASRRRRRWCRSRRRKLISPSG